MLYCLFLFRGWNYVSCIEPIVLYNKNLSKELKCSKITQACRNIFEQEYFDNQTRRSDYSVNVAVALLAGMIGITIMMSSLMQMVQSRDNIPEIEFAPISNERSLS